MKSRWSESWSEFDGLIHPEDIVIRNVRLQSNAGWYMGTAEFLDYEEMQYYSRDSEYYPTEEALAQNYPSSISIEEAFAKIKHDSMYSRKMEKKLAKLKQR